LGLVVTLALFSACSGDEELESPSDTGADSTLEDTSDAESDAPLVELDTATDTQLEVAVDGDVDATSDGELDAPADTALDATLDTTLDGDGDASAEADAATDVAADAPGEDTLPVLPPVCIPIDDAGLEADVAIDAPMEVDATLDDAETAIDASDDAEVATDDAEVSEVAIDASDDSEAATDVADGSDAPVSLPPPTCAATRVRIVSSNLTSGTLQSYEAPGIRILQALHPDIAMMQEFKYAGGVRALVDEAFGKTFQIALEPTPGSIPNGIVSRYPILESGEWDDPDLTDRDFVYARIDVPGPVDLWAVSVHLRTTSATARETEAKNLLAYIRTFVPAGAFLVIGGDLNTAVETEPALVLFSELVLVSSPFAVDQAGSNKTNAPRSKPYDWVLPNSLLFSRMIPVRIGGLSFPSGLVFDTRVYAPLTEVPPALSTDSAATGMQHMAVVRDFALGG